MNSATHVRCILLFILYFIPNGLLLAQDSIRIACVGDSITYGYGLINRENSYPGMLDHKLTEDYRIVNFGVNSACGSSGFSDSYDRNGMIERIQDWDPDVILFMLGSNDSKEKYWVDRDYYISGCKGILESIKSKETRVVIMLPIPSWYNIYGIRNNVVQDKIQPALLQYSKENNYQIIDFTEKLKHKPYLYIDNVHPNRWGYDIISDTIVEFIEDWTQ